MSIPQQRNTVSPYTLEQPSWQADHHPQAPPPTGSDSPGLLRILLRRRKFLVLAAVAAFCIAVIVTMATRSQSWTHDMIVNYTPVTEFNAAYQSPTVNTLAQFMKAPEIEATMREEFPDYDFGPNFDNAFGVVVPYDTQTVEISLSTSDDSYAQAFRNWFSQFFHLKTWSTPPRFVDDWHRRFALAKDNIESSQRRSERVLNRFQTVFAEYVAKERRNALRRHTEDLRESMETWKEKLKVRKSELAAFNEKHRVQDLKLETDALLQQVTSWESRLEEARLAKTATDKELEEIKRRLAALKEATSSAQETADELKKLGHSPQRLIERTQRRMNVEKLRAQVEQEKASFAYDTKLHEKQFLSDKIYQQKKMQLAALEKELEGAERIWQLELQIEAENVAAGGATPGGGDAHSRKFDLELDLVTGEKSIEHLEEKLEEKREQLAKLQALREEGSSLKAQVQIAGEEVIRILGQVLHLERLEGFGVREFTETRPATLNIYSQKSTAKKTFVVTFAFFCLLLGAPVIVRDLLPRRARGAEAQAEQLGIPVLVHASIVPEGGKSTSLATSGEDEHSRLQALRIQQAIPRTDQGAVVLFSGLNQSADVSVLTRLAQCWARRGESVLLLDTGDDPQVQTDLTNLLAAHQITIEHQARDTPADTKDASETEPNGDQPTTLPATNAKNGLPQVAVNGLSNFLADESIDWSELVKQTDVKDVDCVMAGDLPMPAEGLATHRMTEFLHELRQRYSLVVLMGPSTARPVDLELLASRADGIVFTTDGEHDVSERATAVVKNLVDLNAPVLGIIS